jgi:hydrogenase-4 component H
VRIPLPKLRELVEALRAVFKGPFTTKFPAKVDSVHPNFRGIIKFRPEKCICCGACVQVCPTNAREMIVDREKGVMRNIHHAERCIYCGQCVLYCTTRDAIYHTPEFDLSRTERGDWDSQVEQPLAHCETCGEPFAAVPHLVHIAHKVGDLVNANPTLFLSLYRDMGVAPPVAPRGEHQPYRSDTMRVLCPDCRRKTYLAEEWGY